MVPEFECNAKHTLSGRTTPPKRSCRVHTKRMSDQQTLAFTSSSYENCVTQVCGGRGFG